VEGKIHDIKMVVVVGSLFLLTISLTTALRWVKNYGVGFLGLDAYNISWFWALTSLLIAYVITYLMFFFVYRYVPDRWIPRQDAAVAALFSSLLFELAKQVFVAYLAEFGRFLGCTGRYEPGPGRVLDYQQHRIHLGEASADRQVLRTRI
jgi:membrane protein